MNDIRKVGAGAGVMVMRDSKILFGLRHADPEKADSALRGEGTWTFPGGKLDYGDTIDGGAARELLEETGLVAKKLELFSVGNDRNEHAHFVTIGFICTDFEGEPEVKEPDEIIEWKWFDMNELPENIFIASKRMIQNYKDGIIYRENE